MPRRVRCCCRGRPECKLCRGTKYYLYEPGPRGWLPFKCPTCDGTGTLAEPGTEPEPCPTCRATGTVDPADPPTAGIADVLWKALFGA